MRVEVYFNLHSGLWSVRALEGEHKGRVICHASYVEIGQPTLAVREKGRQRVLREKRKNVHAFVRGSLITMRDVEWRYPVEWHWYGNTPSGARALLHGERVTYNPYRAGHFTVAVGDRRDAPALYGTYACMTSARTVYITNLETRREAA